MSIIAKALGNIIAATNENGGGTFRLPNGEPVSEGYAVARPDMIGGHEFKRGNVLDAIADMLDEAHNYVSRVGIIGTWVHEGHYYAEPTTVHDDYDEAVALGTRLGQASIYDLSAGKEVPLKVDPIMRSRVIVTSRRGYGYGQTVGEAKLNHDRLNGMARPIEVKELPDGRMWLRNEYGSIYSTGAKVTHEETATADDILAVVLNRIELDVRADVDYMIRDHELSDDDELNEHAEELPTYVTNALDALTLEQLLTLAQHYTDELAPVTIYAHYGQSLKACIVQALCDIPADELGALEAYNRGVEFAVSVLLEEWALVDLEIGADRVGAINTAVWEWEEENDEND